MNVWVFNLLGPRLFCGVVLRKRNFKLVALFYLFCCHAAVYSCSVCIYLNVPWNGLWYVTVEFPGHTHLLLYDPCRDQTFLRCFRQSETQTSLLSCRDYLECSNFALSSKFRYDTFQEANNKGAIQTARMCRLVCTFVVQKTPKTSFLMCSGPYNVFVLFVCLIVALHPSKQLRSRGDGQFTKPHFFLGKLEQTVNH